MAPAALPVRILFALTGITAFASGVRAQSCDAPTSVVCPGGGTPTCTQGTLGSTTGGDSFGCPLDPGFDATWISSDGGAIDHLRVPKYKALPGVCSDLVRMDIRIRAIARAVIRLENTDNKPRVFDSSITITVLTSPIGLVGWPAPIPLNLPISQSNMISVTAFDQAMGAQPDFLGTSAITINVGPSGPLTRDECFTVTDPALLAQFRDLTLQTTDDFVVFTHQSSDFFTQSGGAQVASIVDTDAAIRIDVTYTTCECQTAAVDDVGRVCVGESTSVAVLANDSTTCGALVPATLAFVTPPPAGFSLSGSNVLFNASGVPSGVYVATYRICNNQASPCCDEGTVTITVCETVAVDDAARVCAGSSVTIPVLANDSTTCGTLVPATLAFVGTPPAGFTISGSNVVYTNSGTPNSGTVTATYRVCNSLAIPCCDTATITVSICNVNAVDDAARVCAGSSVTIPVLSNDSTNCGALVPSTLAFVGTPPAGFTISGSNVVYTNSGTPSSGTVTATYRVCNNETPACCDNGTITVTICSVNAVDDTAARVCAGSSVTIPVLANDTTNCGSLVPSTLAFVGTPPTGFTISGSNVVYTNSGTPSSGTVTATYRVCNNETPACCDTAIVTVTICSVNAVDDTARVCAGSSVTIPVLANDTTNCGSLVPSTLAFVGTPPAGFTISGSNVVYTNSGTPSSGTVTATYRVCNNETPACCDNGTITVTICSVDAVDEEVQACAGTTVTIPVLANDTTNCGILVPSTLTFVGTPPAGFTISGGNIVYTNTGTPSSGTVSATYRICNNESPACCDTGVVRVTLCTVNAVDDPITICCGDVGSVNVLTNDASSCGRLLCSDVEFLRPLPPGFTASGCIATYDSSVGDCPPSVTVRYRLRGGTGLVCLDEANVVITIRSKPIAVDDRIELLPTTTFPLDIDVLANDSPGAGCTFPTCVGCDTATPLDPCALEITTFPSAGMVEILDDCRVRYTPGANFSTGDRFCYRVTNSCGCTATACVTIASCREVDRSTCASLLLFPEYDNREAAMTLFTITYGCCTITDASLWVEVRFIDSLTCNESDFSFPLTPCDTVSFLTSTVNPNSTRGYAYAFVKRLGGGEGGTPIVHNKLIGQAMIINSLENVDYSMNAVAFIGLGPELSDNDDDGDGIRDLNGPFSALPEYEQAPDELLIPRFLAQDPPGPNPGFRSDLILLALTGGQAFTTTVEFAVYNDSEDVTSQQASFYCWDKRPLVQWAPGTLASSLSFQGDDPDEILGIPNQMAGWLRVQGKIASSGLEVIQDPAIYAVLIERYQSMSVADLPFEKCSQANGDLLPTSPLGDGPNPVSGDGQ